VPPLLWRSRVYVPTLEELIEACGNRLEQLQQTLTALMRHGLLAAQLQVGLVMAEVPRKPLRTSGSLFSKRATSLGLACFAFLGRTILYGDNSSTGI
jgi:hypothetical protein